MTMQPADVLSRAGEAGLFDAECTAAEGAPVV